MDNYIANLEMKALLDSGEFEGYASVFNITDSQQDKVLKGAFTQTIANRLPLGEIKLLWQHDPKEPIGIIESLHEDAHGLYIKGRLLLEVARAREAYALLKTGVINGLSIGYAVQDSTYDKNGTRLLKQLELFEVSLVTYPANTASRVERVKQAVPKTEREFESFLRDAGFSRKSARTITSQGFALRDAEYKPLSVDEMLAIDNALDRVIHSLTH